MIILKSYLNLATDYSLEYSYISSQRALTTLWLRSAYDIVARASDAIRGSWASVRYRVVQTLYRYSHTQSIFASQNLICLIARMQCCRIQQYLTLKEV
jgi:hypothetical protein